MPEHDPALLKATGSNYCFRARDGKRSIQRRRRESGNQRTFPIASCDGQGGLDHVRRERPFNESALPGQEG